MKYGKKHFSVDENKRDTYQLLHPCASSREPSLLWNADDLKQLMAVCTESLCYSFLITGNFEVAQGLKIGG